eukprot:749359-Hanusia_phi.AAC.10
MAFSFNALFLLPPWFSVSQHTPYPYSASLPFSLPLYSLAGVLLRMLTSFSFPYFSLFLPPNFLPPRSPVIRLLTCPSGMSAPSPAPQNQCHIT